MTLEMAILHKDALNRAKAEHAHDPRMIWYHGSYTILETKLADSTWAELQMVSLTSTGRVVGWLEASFSRRDGCVDSLSVARFDQRYSLEWARDMGRFMSLLFIEYSVHAVRWNIVVGSPHERSYDKLAALLGGRSWGRETAGAVLRDGTRHDRKHYEVLAENLNRRALARLAGERYGRQDEALARGERQARPEGGDAGAGDERDSEPRREGSEQGGRPLQPGHGAPDGGVGERVSSDAAMRALGNFGARVTDSGGGKVELLVDRDTLFYPAVGSHVEVIAGDPRIRLDAPRVQS